MQATLAAVGSTRVNNQKRDCINLTCMWVCQEKGLHSPKKKIRAKQQFCCRPDLLE